MKGIRKHYSLVAAAAAAALVILICFSNSAAQNSLSPQNTKTAAEFERRAREYSKLRERIEDRLPKLPKDATPKQIEVHKATFQKAVQSARLGVRQGNLFTPAAAQLIKAIIKREFKGKDLLELRKTVMEAATRGVPLKINYPYPETEEEVEMPPELLLNFPQLPKQLRYRFVGRNLLLVDRENGLIVDYMKNALP